MKRSWLRIGIPLLILLAAAAGIEYWLGAWKVVARAIKPLSAGQQMAQACSQGTCGDTCGLQPAAAEGVGPEDAPVKIVAYIYPTNHCHVQGVEALKSLVKKYPGDVRVEVREADSEEGQRVAEQYGIDTLMWLLVNDMDAVKLPGRTEPIPFRGPPGKLTYDLGDIEAIIKYAATDEGARDLEKQRKAKLAKIAPAASSSKDRQTASNEKGPKRGAGTAAGSGRGGKKQEPRPASRPARGNKREVGAKPGEGAGD